MVDVQDDVYDSGGVGDSDLTQVTNHIDTSSGDDRVTQYLYDFRDRMVAVKQGVQSGEAPTLQFAAEQTMATAGPSYGITVADVNGDGKGDLIVTNYATSATIGVMLGNGNGTFGAEQTFATLANPFRVTAADVNGDGQEDLIVIGAPNAVSILLGNGNGTFQASQTFAVTAPSSIAVGDFNGDGKTGSDLRRQQRLRRPHAAGQRERDIPGPTECHSVGGIPVPWQRRTSTETGRPTWSSTTAPPTPPAQWSVLRLGNGNGTFQTPVSFATNNASDFLTVADVNGDGMPDIIVSGEFQGGWMSVLLGTGNGTLSAAADLRRVHGGPCPGWTAGGGGTLNGDGKPDIVTRQSGAVNVLTGNGDGTFGAVQTFAAAGIYSVAIADVNNDGRPDIVDLKNGTGAVGILLNQTGTLAPITYNVLDNLGEIARTYQYDGYGINLSDFSTAAITDAIPTVDPSKVVALTVNSFDELHRLYRTQVYNINQTSGTSGLTDSQILALPNLATNYYYGLDQQLAAVFSPGGQVTKYVYDLAGRLTKQSTTDGGVINGAAQTWNNAIVTTNDVVLQQMLYTYDADGNAIGDEHAPAVRQRSGRLPWATWPGRRAATSLRAIITRRIITTWRAD